MYNVGNITIIESESRFKKVDISLIENIRIDCTTLGIYTKLIVLGKKWNLNVKGLRKHLGLSDEKVRKALSLLEQEGYIVRTPCRNEKGQLLGWDYTIYPIPVGEEERSQAGVKKDCPNNASPSTPKTDHTDMGGVINNRKKEIIEIEKESISKDIPKKEEKESSPKNPQSPQKEKSSAKKKDTPLPFDDEEVRSLWEKLMTYPEWKKKTAHAIELRVKKLERLSKGDVDYCKAILLQTLDKVWLDFYEVKDYKKTTTTIKTPSTKNVWDEMGLTKEQYDKLYK